MRRLRMRLPGERGAITLSYVIVVPVFLLAIMIVAQASVWYVARETALAAARHGADVARTSKTPPGAGAAAAVAFAKSAAPGFLTNVSSRALVTSRGGIPTTVQVTVSGRVPRLIPWMPPKIAETVTAPVERFVALGEPYSAGVDASDPRPWMERR